MSLGTVTVTVTPSPTTITALQASNVTVGVSGGSGTPTGTVVLTAPSGYASSAAVLASGSAVIAVPASELAVGSNTLTATYTADVTSDSVYNSGTTGTATLTVTAVSVVPTKLQGYLAQIYFTPPAGGSPIPLLGLKDLDGEFSSDELDSSDHGGSWKGRMYGMLDFSGSATVDYIAGDTSQEDMLTGFLLARVPASIVLYPKYGTGSGVDKYSGSVVVTSFKWNGKMKDLQGATIAFKNASNQGFAVAAQ